MFVFLVCAFFHFYDWGWRVWKYQIVTSGSLTCRRWKAFFVTFCDTIHFSCLLAIVLWPYSYSLLWNQGPPPLDRHVFWWACLSCTVSDLSCWKLQSSNLKTLWYLIILINIFWAVVCSGGSVKVAGSNRLQDRRAGSALSVKLDPLHVVAVRRMLSKHLSILNNPTHTPHSVLAGYTTGCSFS